MTYIHSKQITNTMNIIYKFKTNIGILSVNIENSNEVYFENILIF